MAPESENPRRLEASELILGAYDFEKGLRCAGAQHWSSSIRLGRLSSLLGAPTAALSAVAGTAILSDATGNWKIAAGWISIAIAALSALATFFAFKDQS